MHPTRFSRKIRTYFNPEFVEPGEPGAVAFTSLFMTFYLSFTVAYFIGDFIVTLVQLDEYGKGFLFHAICGLGGFSWCLLLNKGHSYGKQNTLCFWYA